MVTAYWKIGKSIFEACGGNDRAAYGKQVLQYISERMTAEFAQLARQILPQFYSNSFVFRARYSGRFVITPSLR